MDRKLVSTKQRYEPAYIASTYDVPIEVVRDVLWNAGRSRGIVYAILERLGYKVPETNLSYAQKKKFNDVCRRMGI